MDYLWLNFEQERRNSFRVIGVQKWEISEMRFYGNFQFQPSDMIKEGAKMIKLTWNFVF